MDHASFSRQRIKKQTNKHSNNKKKKKKQARWSLGKDSKGRRISFGFRDENLERNFTTPTRENVTGKYSNSIINNNNNSNDENNQPLSVENAVIDTNDFADVDDNDFEINTPTNNNNNNNRNFTTMKTPNTAMKKQILMSLQEAKETINLSPWIIQLIFCTALLAYQSESFVHFLEPATEQLGFSALFTGIIIIPIVGGFSEYVPAVKGAWKDQMDLPISLAMGSSLLVALLIAPALIIIGSLIGQPMNLDFTAFEVIALIFSVLIVNLDGLFLQA